MKDQKLQLILNQCKDEISKMGTTIHPRTKRYSSNFKKGVSSFIKLGGDKAILIDQLGLNNNAIHRWISENPKNKSFKEIPVVVDRPIQKTSMILHTPHGYQVQFEHPQDLVSVLKLLT